MAHDACFSAPTFSDDSFFTSTRVQGECDLTSPCLPALTTGYTSDRPVRQGLLVSKTLPSSEPDNLVTGDTADVTARDFRAGFGEDLSHWLEVSAWETGWDLTREYARIEREVGDALRNETEVQRLTRQHLFPRLFERGGGVFACRNNVIRAIHEGLLFRGGVEACDGTVQVHDTLPMTIYQIGVSLVSYRGDQVTWYQRLFRRDLRQQLGDSIEELTQLLEQRSWPN